MTTPTQPQTAQTQTTKQSIGVFTAIAAVVTMLAVRWSGYAALPYVVIFAPVLAVAGILLLILALIIISLIVSAVAGAASGR